MKFLNLLQLFFFMILTNSTLAQDQYFIKHPKVIEVEMLLTKEASSFIQQRLPKESAFVNVEIDPLRRTSGDKKEQLPYFYSEDEIGDEWDAIDTPTILLMSRIKKAKISIELSKNVSEAEVNDLKEKLYQHLKLIPGRDNISIERKERASNNNTNDFTIYYFITTIMVTSLIGLFFILKYTRQQGGKSASSPSTPITASQAASNSPPIRSSNSKVPSASLNGMINSKVNGDINFKDSIRAADLLKEKLHGVVNAPIFPLLSDMLILEELSTKSLSSFGAFVFEMPRKHQQKIFFRGRSDQWFKGYIEAASVDMDCFLAVEKMLRNRTASGSEKWEELLVQVWRLNDESYLFLKQIPQDEAFTILAHLPKSFAVPMAKKAFPGAWARVLEKKEVFPIDDEMKIEDYLEKTLRLKPYFSFKSIDEYRRDLELIDYLKIANIKDEEDIYESLQQDSNIFSLRPPFYKILKSNEDDLKEFIKSFDLSDWALALINSPREINQTFISHLDDKKKYLYRNILKQYDEAGFDLKMQIEMKEIMAKQFKIYLEGKKASGTNKGEISAEININNEEEIQNEDNQAA